MRKIKIRLLLAFLGLMIFVLPLTAARREALPSSGGIVFVTERQLGSVTAFDAATGVAHWTATVGVAPIGVTQPRGTKKVYTSDEGSNQMSVVDRETGVMLGTIAMGPLPHHLMASSDGQFIYVGEFGHNQIGVVDTATDNRVAGFVASPLSNARTHAVWITRNGNDLYATNSRVDRSQPGDVAHLNANTGELLCNTIVGADPSEILVTPDGRFGYVSVRRENKVKELDLRDTCPVLTGREAVVGTMPDTLQLTNDGQTLIITLRGSPAQISLLDTQTFAVQILNIPGHTTTGHHWLSQNSRFSFVAVESPAGLAVIDNETRTVVADYLYPNPPGGTRAHGVFYIPSVLPGDNDD
ncbi:MAG TPA: beta-propeller fold lactonase family protein [Pyrinomonadaceae bacterium]|nr:beta-propeller fold lactonase family protein [Pyrinomonadaceae bacterium]